MLDTESFGQDAESGVSVQKSNFVPLLKFKAAKLDFNKSEAMKRWFVFLLTMIIPYISHFINKMSFSSIFVVMACTSISAVLIFRESLFNIVHKHSHEQHSYLNRVYPFEGLRFYLSKGDVKNGEPGQKTIFIIHDLKKNEVVLVGGIRLEKLALGVHPNLRNFLTGLYLKGIPVYFENKLINEFNLSTKQTQSGSKANTSSFYVDPTDFKSQFTKIDAMKYKKENDKKAVSFCIFTEVKVSLNQPVRDALNSALDSIQRNLNTIFRSASSNFPHYRFDMLSDESLIASIQSVFTDIEIPTDIIQDIDKWGDKFESKVHKYSFGLKLVYFLIFCSTMGYLFGNFWYGVICGLVICGWFVLKERNKQDLSEIMNFQRINPFSQIEFLTHRHNPTAMFIHIPKTRMIKAIRTVSIQGIGEFFNFNMDKIFREQLFDMVSTITSVQAVPIAEDLPKFQEKFGQMMDSRNLLSPKLLERIQNRAEEAKAKGNEMDYSINYGNYCVASSGFWYLKYLLTVVSGVDDYYNLPLAIQMLSDDLNDNLKTIVDIFITKLRDVSFRDISPSQVEVSPKMLFLKNFNNFLYGSMLPEFPMSGARMSQLVSLPVEYQKSIDTVYPAEFQAPISLTSEIIYGKIINTEFNRKESPYGFNFDNIFNTNLIFGGNDVSRFKIALKMIYENIRVKIPTIILDMNGYWKHILSLFRGTEQESKIKILTLGDNYGINPFYPELDNDPNIDAYLSSITSIFSYLYRVQAEDDALLKECLYSAPQFELKDLDAPKILSMMDLRLTDSKSEMRKISLIYSVMQEFSSAINLKAFRKPALNKPAFNSLLSYRGCIIFDMSKLEQRKKYFTSLVVLKKVSHLLKQAPNENVMPMMLYISEIDKLFHNQNASRTNTELLIPQLFSGIIEHGFGFFGECGAICDLNKEFIRIINNVTALQIHTEDELRVATEVLKLDKYFSNENNSQFRKNSYQIEFLKHLKENQALIRREDHEFPFAVEFDITTIQNNFKVLDNAEFEGHAVKTGMKNQSNKEKMIKTIEMTQFERDLTEFKFVIEDIAKFMAYIKELEKTTSGLSKKAIREELDHAIGEKIYMQVRSSEIKNRKIKTIIELLVAKEYFIKNPHTLGKAQTKVVLYMVNPANYTLIEQWKNTVKAGTSTLQSDSNSFGVQNLGLGQNVGDNFGFNPHLTINDIDLSDIEDFNDPLIDANFFETSESTGQDIGKPKSFNENENENDMGNNSGNANKNDGEIDDDDLFELESADGFELDVENSSDAEDDQNDDGFEGNPIEMLDDSFVEEDFDDFGEGAIDNAEATDSEVDGFYDDLSFIDSPVKENPTGSSSDKSVKEEQADQNFGNTLNTYLNKEDKEIKPKTSNAQHITVKSEKLAESGEKKLEPINFQKSLTPIPMDSLKKSPIKTIQNKADLSDKPKITIKSFKDKQEVFHPKSDQQQFYNQKSRDIISELIKNFLLPKKIDVDIKIIAKKYVEASQIIRNAYASFFVKYFNSTSTEIPTREALILYFDQVLNEDKNFPFNKEELVGLLKTFESNIESPDEIKESKRIFEKFINLLDFYVSSTGV